MTGDDRKPPRSFKAGTSAFLLAPRGPLERGQHVKVILQGPRGGRPIMLEMTGSEPAGEEKTRVSTFIPFDFTPGEYSVVHAVVMPRAGVAALPTLIPLEEFGDERTIVIESE